MAARSLFKMLPKPGDSTQANNWRPTAALKITFAMFATGKLLGARIRIWKAPGKSIEWDMWCASLGLKKGFDRIEHTSLFKALHAQGVPQ